MYFIYHLFLLQAVEDLFDFPRTGPVLDFAFEPAIPRDTLVQTAKGAA